MAVDLACLPPSPGGLETASKAAPTGDSSLADVHVTRPYVGHLSANGPWPSRENLEGESSQLGKPTLRQENAPKRLLLSGMVKYSPTSMTDRGDYSDILSCVLLCSHITDIKRSFFK